MSTQILETLAPNEQKAVEVFIARLRKHYPDRISEIILFGSKARGDSQPESDIDILLVADTDEWRFRHAVSDLASDVSLDYGVLIAAQVVERTYWERMACLGFGLHENVVREGVSLLT